MEMISAQAFTLSTLEVIFAPPYMDCREPGTGAQQGAGWFARPGHPPRGRDMITIDKSCLTQRKCSFRIVASPAKKGKTSLSKEVPRSKHSLDLFRVSV